VIRVLYFAALRDAAGCAEEGVADAPATLGQLYELLAGRHGFTLARERVRVARNGEFARWDDAAAPGDEIAFLPPVSGG
jgi:molybdopterin synthase sulfur carrier subunit